MYRHTLPGQKLVYKEVKARMGQNTRMESKKAEAGPKKIRSWLDVVKGNNKDDMDKKLTDCDKKDKTGGAKQENR